MGRIQLPFYTPREIYRSYKFMKDLEKTDIHMWTLYNQQTYKNRCQMNIKAGYYPPKTDVVKKAFIPTLIKKGSSVINSIKTFFKGK